ncbi:MAG: O-antigen ligase family protein [Patescibacteria group bacterium]|nr:O-antigen ligase family protein [Patescibacteria group bacterium]MCL5224187.1 O-antigen ligase family protein [Patescibacteria group bacterium]
MEAHNNVDRPSPAVAQWEMIVKTVSKVALILLGLVPLIVDGYVIFPYISGKMIAIRIAVTLVLLSISLGLIISRRFRHELYARVRKLIHNPIFLTASAFMLSIGLSAIFAVDKYRAFWGNVERAEGFVGIFSYFIFIPLAYLIFSRKDWLWFFKTSLGAGIILFINEVMSLPTDPTAARPGSFTGNPSFLAGYLLFVIASAIIIVYNAKREDRASSEWSVIALLALVGVFLTTGAVSGWLGLTLTIVLTPAAIALIAVYNKRVEGKISRLFWQAIPSLTIAAAIVGMFLTQTRGTLLGLAAGFVILAIYWAIKGKHITVFRKLSLRRAAILLMVILVAFAAVFFVTRSDSFWQKIPGMNRFAQLSLDHIINDPTVQTRLISDGIGLKAMNPVSVGYLRLVFGWGQENFGIAYNSYYNPRYFEFEQEWFDRAHDKLMDVLVMNGVIGLISYLALWMSFIWVGFKKKEFSVEKMALLFFGVAFFVNLLSLFDQVSTYIPLFAALGLMAYLRDEEHHESEATPPPRGNSVFSYILYTVVGVISLFMLYVLVVSMTAYVQMHEYIGLLQSQDLVQIENGLDGVTSPYNYAQQDIRGELLSAVTARYTSTSVSYLQPLMDKAIGLEEQVVNMDPYDPRQSLIIATAYDTEGIAATSTAAATTYYQEAEQYYRRAYQLAPERQDVILPLVQNLFYQRQNSEALALLIQCYQEDPNVVVSNYELGYVLSLTSSSYYSEALPLLNFTLDHYASNLSQLGNIENVIKVYESFVSYFYNTKNAADFAETMHGLTILEPYNSANFSAAATAAQTGNWSAINLKSI